MLECNQIGVQTMEDEAKITDMGCYTHNPNKDIGNRSHIQQRPLDADLFKLFTVLL
jgi:hypothetical protein